MATVASIGVVVQSGNGRTPLHFVRDRRMLVRRLPVFVACWVTEWVGETLSNAATSRLSVLQQWQCRPLDHRLIAVVIQNRVH